MIVDSLLRETEHGSAALVQAWGRIISIFVDGPEGYEQVSDWSTKDQALETLAELDYKPG